MGGPQTESVLAEVQENQIAAPNHHHRDILAKQQGQLLGQELWLLQFEKIRQDKRISKDVQLPNHQQL
eukprot:scaffold12969_cov65-Attheya_sp.AAC.11